MNGMSSLTLTHTIHYISPSIIYPHQFAMLLPYDSIPRDSIHNIICHTLTLFNDAIAKKPGWAKPNSLFANANGEFPTKFRPGGYLSFIRPSATWL